MKEKAEGEDGITEQRWIFRGLLALLWRGSDFCRVPLPASCPGRSPVFTRTSPPQPTATNHAGRGMRATMARHTRGTTGSLRGMDFATLAQTRPHPTPNRFHLRYCRLGSYHAALHPASRRRSCASVINFFHGFCCAGSPTRRGCAARRRTRGGFPASVLPSQGGRNAPSPFLNALSLCLMPCHPPLTQLPRQCRRSLSGVVAL